MCKAYAPVREDAAKRKAATSRDAPRNAKGQLQPVGEQIPQPERDSRKTRTVRAKIAETNPKYIDLADRLYVEDREAFEQVHKGEKTLTQVQRDEREAR